jgi:hypothetical protein
MHIYKSNRIRVHDLIRDYFKNVSRANLDARLVHNTDFSFRSFLAIILREMERVDSRIHNMVNLMLTS